jgi:nickel transport system ATP-binding protein
MATEPVLAIRNLCAGLAGVPRRPVLRDVSLEVRPGEVLGLIGASGSGKSMTCLSVMGLLPGAAAITSGRVLVNGKASFARGRDVAMILQNPATCFDAVMTIRAHFKESLAALGVNWERGCERAFAAMIEAGFDSPEDVMPLYPFQMSGGMLQRTMTALAMCGDPRLLLADEPTTDLDMPAQAKALDLIGRLRDTRGLGVLLVTHDLSVIARLASRVAVMENGRIVETGPAGQMFEAPRSAAARALVSAHFALHEAFDRGGGGKDRPRDAGHEALPADAGIPADSGGAADAGASAQGAAA